ncbi:hypothetical protein BIW11_04043 [Tropilaelaps mercedesae]|uniref:Uncharacterized protein n=1 Tax=Tropilaelaps mercedesae TaxID=418985 RepID=A0A1V9XCK1_9ACAR|nr:hypothetical protein BIW11_04043 [Tropilaelaps mercedesae]
MSAGTAIRSSRRCEFAIHEFCSAQILLGPLRRTRVTDSTDALECEVFWWSSWVLVIGDVRSLADFVNVIHLNVTETRRVPDESLLEVFLAQPFSSTPSNAKDATRARSSLRYGCDGLAENASVSSFSSRHHCQVSPPMHQGRLEIVPSVCPCVAVGRFPELAPVFWLFQRLPASCLASSADVDSLIAQV